MKNYTSWSWQCQGYFARFNMWVNQFSGSSITASAILAALLANPGPLLLVPFFTFLILKLSGSYLDRLLRTHENLKQCEVAVGSCHRMLLTAIEDFGNETVRTLRALGSGPKLPSEMMIEAASYLLEEGKDRDWNVKILNQITPLEWNTSRFRLYSLVLHQSLSRTLKLHGVQRISVLDAEDFELATHLPVDVASLKNSHALCQLLAENYLWGVQHFAISRDDFRQALREFSVSMQSGPQPFWEEPGFLLYLCTSAPSYSCAYEGSPARRPPRNCDETWPFPVTHDLQRLASLEQFYEFLQPRATVLPSLDFLGHAFHSLSVKNPAGSWG